MHADLKGALNQINKSWGAFVHNGKPLSKDQVKAILIYGINKGYKSTEDFEENEIDNLLTPNKTTHA